MDKVMGSLNRLFELWALEGIPEELHDECMGLVYLCNRAHSLATEKDQSLASMVVSARVFELRIEEALRMDDRLHAAKLASRAESV